MTGSDWHLDDAQLAAYLQKRTALPLTASLEAHLLRCPTCRARLRPTVDRPRLDRVWDRVVDDVCATPTRTERVAARLGVHERDSLLVGVAPAVRGSWLLSVVLCVLITLATVATELGGDRRGFVVFLVVAPLVPVAVVALSYGQEADPLWETSLATGFPPLRLLLLRSGAVLVTAVPVTVVAAWILPGSGWTAATWLLPSLACTTTTLALTTWFAVRRSAIAVGTVWTAVALAATGPGFHDTLLVLSTPVLPVYVAVAAAAGVVLVLRIDRFSVLGRNS
jgi:hypothetical protein